MRSVEFGEALPAGTRLTFFSDDKPDRFFTITKFWMEDEEARTYLLIHLTIEEQDEDRWCLWRPDHADLRQKLYF